MPGDIITTGTLVGVGIGFKPLSSASRAMSLPWKSTGSEG
jgi:2-keto-4-pentenoate hydratase/2-oxohepta-3-ene-1,7-dioic acid hydratase in catechol pathway